MAPLIPLARRPLTLALPAPGPCPDGAAQAGYPHGSHRRPIPDCDHAIVEVRRYRCQVCRRTITVKPEGVDRPDRRRAFRALIGVLYRGGLSLRRLAWMWVRFGYDVS